MKSLLLKIVDGLREDFGHPVSLIRLLQEHPDIRVPLDGPKPPCIAAESIVPWHELGASFHHHYGHHLSRSKPGTLMGWHRRDKYSYGSFLLHRPEYAVIGQRQIDDNWVCDITDVHGFAASKSELRDFASTDLLTPTEN